MTFKGVIKSVSTFDIFPDVVEISGHVANKPCKVRLECDGLAELLIGRYGFNKDEVEMEIKGDF